MNKISKIVCIALSASLAVGTAAYLPSGTELIYAGEHINEEDYIFDEEKGTCEVDYKCRLRGDVFIPDTVEHNGKEYPVVSVPSCSFEYATSVYLGANIDLISYKVDCFPDLKMITVSPDNKSLTVKDGVLFEKYKSYDGEYSNRIALYPTCKEDKEYTIAADLEGLPDLNKNPYLEKLTISEGMEYGLYYYFDNCKSLKSVYIPDTLNAVGDNAFGECPALTDIYYGGSIKKWNVISKFKREGVTIHTENEKAAGDLKYLVRNDGTCRVSGYNETIPKDLIIPQCVNIEGNQYTVTEIDVSAFSDCSTLETVEIPQTVEIIHQEAFSNCKNLKRIVTHNSIKSIGAYAFSSCSALESIKFDDTTEVIGDSAFEGCSSIKTVNIPQATEMIGNLAFYNCKDLGGINVDIRNKFFSSSDGEVYGKSGTIITAVRKSNMTDRSVPETFRSVMPPDISGDVDRDGQVDVNDLLLISMYLLRDTDLDGAGKRFADCNGDGSVDVSDLAHIKQYIMKDKVELKKGPAVPDESCLKMLELVKSKTAEGSPLDVGYEAAGYKEMYSKDHNVSIFDGGYSCSLNEYNSRCVRKDGYYDEYSIVTEISEESSEEDIENFRRIIDYIDNEAGKDNYYLYDIYKKESHNLYYPWSFNPTEDDHNEHCYGEASSDNSYFVEIVLKSDGDEYKDPDAYKNDYVVTYEIVNKTSKYFTSEKPLVSIKPESQLLSEYPYHIMSYPKIISVVKKYNEEFNIDLSDNKETVISKGYNSDILLADTSFTKVLWTEYGMITTNDILCCGENDHNALDLKINVWFKGDEGRDKVRSQIDNMVSYFEKSGIKIIVPDDIDLSGPNFKYFRFEIQNGQFYLKKGMWPI